MIKWLPIIYDVLAIKMDGVHATSRYHDKYLITIEFLQTCLVKFDSLEVGIKGRVPAREPLIILNKDGIFIVSMSFERSTV